MRNNDDESSQEPLALKLFNSAFKMIMKDTDDSLFKFSTQESLSKLSAYLIFLGKLKDHVYVINMRVKNKVFIKCLKLDLEVESFMTFIY